MLPVHLWLYFLDVDCEKYKCDNDSGVPVIKCGLASISALIPRSYYKALSSPSLPQCRSIQNALSFSHQLLASPPTPPPLSSDLIRPWLHQVGFLRRTRALLLPGCSQQKIFRREYFFGGSIYFSDINCNSKQTVSFRVPASPLKNTCKSSLPSVSFMDQNITKMSSSVGQVLLIWIQMIQNISSKFNSWS